MSPSVKPENESSVNTTSIPPNVSVIPVVIKPNQHQEAAIRTKLNIKSAKDARTTTVSYRDFYDTYNSHTNYMIRNRKSKYHHIRVDLNILNVIG